MDDMPRMDHRKRFEKANAESLSHEHFALFVDKLLRGLANGGPFDSTIHHAFEHERIASENEVTPEPHMKAELMRVSERGLPNDLEEDEHDIEITNILRASIRVFVERTCDDPAARGRLSKRRSALEEAIEQHIIARERRSRKHGSSYLRTLMYRWGF